MRKVILLAACALAALAIVGCSQPQLATETLRFGGYEIDYPAKWGAPTELQTEVDYGTDAPCWRWDFDSYHYVEVTDLTGCGMWSADFLMKIRADATDGETEVDTVGGVSVTSTWLTVNGNRRAYTYAVDDADVTYVVRMEYLNMPSADEWAEMEEAAATVRPAA